MFTRLYPLNKKKKLSLQEMNCKFRKKNDKEIYHGAVLKVLNFLLVQSTPS